MTDPVIGFDRRVLCVCVVPQVELKFPAPSKTGNYQYSVILRSDSYLGLDQIKPLKVTEQLCVCVYACMRVCVYVCVIVWRIPATALLNLLKQ